MQARLQAPVGFGNRSLVIANKGGPIPTIPRSSHHHQWGPSPWPLPKGRLSMSPCLRGGEAIVMVIQGMRCDDLELQDMPTRSKPSFWPTTVGQPRYRRTVSYLPMAKRRCGPSAIVHMSAPPRKTASRQTTADVAAATGPQRPTNSYERVSTPPGAQAPERSRS